MRKAGGLLALVAGLYGLVAAAIALIVIGGIGPAARIGDIGVWLGWGGVAISLITIALSAICMCTTSVKQARRLVVISFLGTVFGLKPVSFCLAVACAGGLMLLFASASKPLPSARPATLTATAPKPGRRSMNFLRWARYRKKLA